MAIEKNEVFAMNNYAFMLVRVKGIETKPVEAIKYLKMGIDLGNAMSMRYYADLLEHGIGVEADIK